jgi:hypothetical protein
VVIARDETAALKEAALEIEAPRQKHRALRRDDR